MNKKQLKSNFVRNLDIDIENFIVELLIIRKLEWRNQSKPNCAFWTNKYRGEPEFQRIADEYSKELQYIKRLFFSFHPNTVLNYIKNSKITTLVFQPKQKQQEIIYRLWLDDCKLKKDLKKKKKRTKTEPTVEEKYNQRSSMKNKLSELF